MRANHSGLVVNLSSLAGRLVFPYFGVYCASKWALEAYTESLKYELSSFGVDVAIVEPGPFPSGLLYSGPKEDDTTVLDSYGEIAEIPGGMLANFDNLYKSPDSPVTQDVADAIVGVIESKAGTRSFRTVAGLDFDTIDLNTAAEPFQKGLVKDVLQMEHVLELRA